MRKPDIEHLGKGPYLGKSPVNKNILKTREQLRSVIALPDIHYPTNIDLSPVYDFIRDMKPDEVILLGDYTNADQLSPKYRTTDAENGIYETIEELEGFIKEVVVGGIQKASPESKLVVLGGNHFEQRADKSIRENKSRERLLDLKQYFPHGVKFLKYNEFYKVGDLYYTHGMYCGELHAKKTLMAVTRNLIYGHVHDHQVFVKKSPVDSDPVMAKSVGCLCNPDPYYLHKTPNSWVNGFHIAFFRNDGRHYDYFIQIQKDGSFFFNNKLYEKHNRPTHRASGGDKR